MSLKSTHLERMRTAIIYDCEFKIAVERGRSLLVAIPCERAKAVTSICS